MSRSFRSYWYLDGDLHCVVDSLPSGQLQVFNYRTEEYKTLFAHVWEHKKEEAYGVTKLGELLNRSPWTIRRWASQGVIPRGDLAYSLAPSRRPIARFWDKDGVMECWHAASKQYAGRPRKDGTGKLTVPSKQELRAKLNQDNVVYIKKDGALIPVWKELT